MYEMEKSYPAPWSLNGEGFIIVFWSNQKKVLETGFLSEEDQRAFRGGLGAIILANYHTSDVGPYHELLYIPGDFQHGKKKYKRITKIYVSSALSVREGIRNWAIPKELANFDWVSSPDKTHIHVQVEKKSILQLEYSSLLFHFPITTALLPFVLLQKNQDHYLRTKFRGRGKAQFSKILQYKSNLEYFPNLDVASLNFPALKVNPFELMFTEASRVEL